MPPRMAADDPIRVMVVDDQEDVRFLIGVILGDHGDMVIVADAPTAAEALERFDDAAPDVVIVDARMPVVDGFELAREMLVRRPSLPVALLTTVVDERIEEQAEASGVRAVLSKGEFDALPDVVRELASGNRGG
jgi:DNA-binding NarL/FixJ family response regulator